MNSERIVGSYGLSPMQQGMLFHSLDQHESGVDVEQIVCSLEEELNVDGFLRAWAEVVAHHDILRSSFGIGASGDPVQEVHERAEIDCERLDWSALSRAEQEHRFRELLADDRLRGFDLGRPPLLRLALIRLADRSWKVLWTFHHILLDGRSFPIVLREAFGLYEGIRNGRPFEPPRPRPYREYIEWLAGQDLSRAELHWRAALKGFSAPTPIGTSRPSERGRGVHTLRLPEQTTTALRGFAETCGVTLNTLIQGAWAILLHRYSGEPEVVFGATRACRRSALEGAEDMVGLFINTLPVRVAVDEGRPLAEWLQALRTEQTGVRPVEHTPLSLVQGWSEVPRGTPLFDSIVVFENYLLDTALRSAGGEWAARHFEYIGQTSLPVTLIAYADPSLLLRLEYYRNRLDDESAGRMLGHLRVLLEGMQAGAQQQLADLPMLTAAEEHELLSRWGHPGARRTTPTCIHDRFAAQAAATPDAVAVTCQDASLSYRELDRRANRMAHRLRAAGVGPDVLVGLCVERSLDMVAAILAILKAGGAYVPLDPAYPADRIAFMLEDAALPVVVTDRALASRVPAGGARVLLLDELAAGTDEPPVPVSGVAPEHLAYVIYTSGSTGRPKGILISHANLLAGSLLGAWIGAALANSTQVNPPTAAAPVTAAEPLRKSRRLNASVIGSSSANQHPDRPTHIG